MSTTESEFVTNLTSTTLPPTSNITDDSTYNTFIFFFNTIAVGSISILGMLGNLASILVLQRDRHNRVAVFLLQVLALAESFLLLVSLVVLTICFGILKTYMASFEGLIIPYMIKYLNPIGFISQCFVIWSTVLLALNRYAAVCRPFSSKRWLKLSSARFQVVVVLCFSISVNLPRFFIYDIQDSPNAIPLSNSSNVSNYSSFIQRNHSQDGQHKTYRRTSLGSNKAFNLYYLSIFYTSIILVLPLILLVALNIPLIRQLQKSKRRMKDNCLAYDGKNEDNITWTMVVIILELVICHTPERICEIVKHLSGKDNSDQFLLYVMNISNFLVIVNSSTDFIVYYLLKTRFRKEFWRKVNSCLKKDDDFSTEDGQTSVNLGNFLNARSGSKIPANSDSMAEMETTVNQNRYRRLKTPENGQARNNSIANQKSIERFVKNATAPQQKDVKPLSVELNGGKLLSSVSTKPDNENDDDGETKDGN